MSNFFPLPTASTPPVNSYSGGSSGNVQFYGSPMNPSMMQPQMTQGMNPANQFQPNPQMQMQSMLASGYYNGQAGRGVLQQSGLNILDSRNTNSQFNPGNQYDRPEVREDSNRHRSSGRGRSSRRNDPSSSDESSSEEEKPKPKPKKDKKKVAPVHAPPSRIEVPRSMKSQTEVKIVPAASTPKLPLEQVVNQQMVHNLRIYTVTSSAKSGTMVPTTEGNHIISIEVVGPSMNGITETEFITLKRGNTIEMINMRDFQVTALIVGSITKTDRQTLMIDLMDDARLQEGVYLVKLDFSPSVSHLFEGGIRMVSCRYPEYTHHVIYGVGELLTMTHPLFKDRVIVGLTHTDDLLSGLSPLSTIKVECTDSTLDLTGRNYFSAQIFEMPGSRYSHSTLNE